MKAIITAAGLGTRSGLNGVLRKELLNIYDRRQGNLLLRPIIDVLINRLKNAGVSEIAVVLDPNDKITRNYLEATYSQIEFFFQKEKKGFGDAVLCARDFIREEGFIVAAGDGLILDFDQVRSTLSESERHKRWMLFVMKVDNPKKYGIAVIDRQVTPFKVTKVIEKPEVPLSNLALCAFYYLPPEIFEHFTYKDGSAELTNAIGETIESGITFYASEIPRKDWVSVGVADNYRHVLNDTYKFVTGKV